MDDIQSGSPVHNIDPNDSASRRTWPRGMPALRIGRRVRRRQDAPHPEQGASSAKAPAAVAIALDAPPPRFLRLARLCTGVALLTLAWLGVVAVILLVEHIGQPFTRQHLAWDILGTVCIAAAAVLAAITVVGCLVVGAFCVSLALTTRGWQ